jgi:hypothetical protein
MSALSKARIAGWDARWRLPGSEVRVPGAWPILAVPQPFAGCIWPWRLACPVHVRVGLPDLPGVFSATRSYSERLFDYRTIGALDLASVAVERPKRDCVNLNGAHQDGPNGTHQTDSPPASDAARHAAAGFCLPVDLLTTGPLPVCT